MIKKLVIRNYALIDNLEIDFSQGLSVITGETGAGKSIILGALSLILGQRADTRVVTDASLKTVVEGTFDISGYNLGTFFDENDIEYDATDCLLRREIAPSGKSRAFINDTPVTVAQLKTLGEQLIDIHSQHQNLLLADSRFQLRIVDVLADNASLRNDYRNAYKEYTALSHRYDEMQKQLAASRTDEDYLRFQWGQLNEANLVDGEQEELETEQERLAHAEELKEKLYEINALLDSEEGGILNNLKTLLSRIRSVEKYFATADSLAERTESAHIELKDIDATFADYNEQLNIDPARLEWVEQRLDTLYTLQQKHHVQSVAQLIALRDSLAQRLNVIDNSDAEIEALQREVEAARKVMVQLADKLTASRKSVAPRLATQIAEMVAPLGMPHVQVAVDLTAKPYDENGAEQATIRFSANKNQPLQPVGDIASGGEISRLMLCIKSLVAGALALPTIIFDEIDTGVSGDIAAKMGHIMQHMARYMQVVAITHLPQVAAMGNHHYRVYKDNTGETTHTLLLSLDEKERVEEIARMLSGTTLTEAALNNARALIETCTE